MNSFCSLFDAPRRSDTEMDGWCNVLVCFNVDMFCFLSAPFMANPIFLTSILYGRLRIVCRMCHTQRGRSRSFGFCACALVVHDIDRLTLNLCAASDYLHKCPVRTVSTECAVDLLHWYLYVHTIFLSLD